MKSPGSSVVARRIAVVVLVGVILLSAGLFWLSSGDSPPSPRIELVAAKRGTVSSVVSAAGTTVDANTRELAFGADGDVEKVYVKVGDKVDAGQILAKIDDSRARERYEEAKAKLAAAEETLENIRNGTAGSAGGGAAGAGGGAAAAGRTQTGGGAAGGGTAGAGGGTAAAGRTRTSDGTARGTTGTSGAGQADGGADRTGDTGKTDGATGRTDAGKAGDGAGRTGDAGKGGDRAAGNGDGAGKAGAGVPAPAASVTPSATMDPACLPTGVARPTPARSGTTFVESNRAGDRAAATGDGTTVKPAAYGLGAWAPRPAPTPDAGDGATHSATVTATATPTPARTPTPTPTRTAAEPEPEKTAEPEPKKTERKKSEPKKSADATPEATARSKVRHVPRATVTVTATATVTVTATVTATVTVTATPTATATQPPAGTPGGGPSRPGDVPVTPSETGTGAPGAVAPSGTPSAPPSTACPTGHPGDGQGQSQGRDQGPNQGQGQGQGQAQARGRSGTGPAGSGAGASGFGGLGGGSGASRTGGAGQATSEAQAEAAVSQAKNELEDAKEALAGVVIKAPVAGTILSIAGAVGDAATANSPFITLGNLDELQVKAMVTQSDVEKLKVGQRAEVTLATRVGERYTGTVTHIDPVATTSGDLVQYGVLIAFTRRPPDLLLGQNATITVTTEKTDNAVYIPAQAARLRADGTAIVTVETGTGTAQRTVRTGIRGDQYIEVLDGLHEGDRVALTASATSGEFPDGTFPGLDPTPSATPS